MELLSKLGVQPTLLIAQIVNIAILVIVLAKVLYKPLMNLMEERSKRIEEGLKNAAAAKEELARVEVKTATMLNEARQEAQALRESIRNQTAQEQQTVIRQTQEQSKKMIDEARERAQEERTAIVSQATGDIATLVSAATTVVLGKVITPELDEQFIAETLRSIKP